MTAREIFEYSLIELNKVEAPSLLLEDYNYFINKAINQYVNKMYNFYDLNQQKTDDLRVLKDTTILNAPEKSTGNFSENVYKFSLPSNYFHILNCVVQYEVKKAFKCYPINSIMEFGARRLTADMHGQIINNYYMRPMYKRPYYFINNQNLNSQVDSYPINCIVEGTVTEGDKEATISGLIIATAKSTTSSLTKLNTNINPKSAITNGTLKGKVYTINHDLIGVINGSSIGVTTSGSITGNATILINDESPIIKGSPITIEIRYGKDESIFKIKRILVDYLKIPTKIRLTQEQIDETEDNSQVLEFPDYVCQEIINELVKLLMENASDPRLQSNIPINQTIAPPPQVQQPNRG